MITALFLVLAQDPQTLTRTGEHFVIEHGVYDVELAEGALHLAEASWPVAAGLLLQPEFEVVEPIRVRLEVPIFDKRVLERVEFPLKVQAQLLRNAADAAVAKLAANQEWHPEWLSEGIRSWVELRTLTGLRRVSTLEREPRYATHEVVAARVHASGRWPDFGAFLGGSLAEHDAREISALRAVFFRELAKDENRIKTLMQAAVNVSGGEDYVLGLNGALRGIYGPEFWQSVGESLVHRNPDWEQLRGSLTTRGPRWMQLAPLKTDAVVWSMHPAIVENWSLDGDFELFGGAQPAAEVLLDRTETGHVVLSFELAEGVSISQYAASSGRRTRLSSAKAKLKRGTQTKFRISKEGENLRIFVDGKQVLAAECAWESNGTWGLGVSAGSGVAWSEIRVP